MPAASGYRRERLRRLREARHRRRLTVLLVSAAALVAFAAVVGGWYAAERWLGGGGAPTAPGYLVALTLVDDGGDPVGAAIVVRGAVGRPALYSVPGDLLLEGPHGEYVFAADSLRTGTFAADLGRVLRVEVGAVYRVPAAAMARLAGGGRLRLALDEPVVLEGDGRTWELRDGSAVAAEEAPALMAAAALHGGRPGAAVQVALWRAVLDTAGLRPAGDRAALAAEVAALARPTGGRPPLRRVLADLLAGTAAVDRLPSGSRTAEGQFAFLPDPDGIMVAVTRLAPGYRAAVTVEVLNGCGRAGVGEAVVERLAVLDVNLPAPRNADSFAYRQTQILTAPDSLAVARDVRAILGTGVVLDGTGLPARTVRVIVGADLEGLAPEPKDQQ